MLRTGVQGCCAMTSGEQELCYLNPILLFDVFAAECIRKVLHLASLYFR
ncbi:hypothetical protein Barb6_03013 [Bacteroidales bacterium Barb6]|nr:hypothetical protein Barb6_03013 [Bacteroidales bacterium Barb6]